jgi:hypothetical protein
MPRIRLNLKNLTVTEKIAKGRQIVTAMTNNPSFPNPIPPLTTGKRYWFRVAAVSAGGQSGWSEQATKVVP